MDSDGQLTFEDNIVSIQYKQCFQHIINYDFKGALSAFKMMQQKLSTDEVKEAILIMEFWAERQVLIQSSKNEEEELIQWEQSWKEFQDWWNLNNLSFTELLDQLKRLVLTKISNLLIFKFHKSEVPDFLILNKLGYIFIENKEWDKAKETLLYSIRLVPKNPEGLALLSDLLWLQGEEEKSRLYLRESFIINCDEVPVDRLKSSLVREIKYLTEKEGHNKENPLIFQRWMPVVATCYNLFSSKKVLLSDEILQLEEDCIALEQEILEAPYKEKLLCPVLLFKTLVLMDHFLMNGDIETAKMLKYEIRLKKFHIRTYELYRKNVFLMEK